MHASRHGTIYYKGTPDWDKRPSLPDDYNCRCYYSPVLKPPKGIAQNPELLTTFETQAGPVMDPLVFGQWFARATEKERQTVVGVRRYNAMAKTLGSAPTWSDFVDEAGNLRPLKQLATATSQEILARRAANDVKFATLHDQLLEIRKTSFVVNPSIPPPSPKPMPPPPPAARKRTSTTSTANPLTAPAPKKPTPTRTPAQVRTAMISDKSLKAAHKAITKAKAERDALWGRIAKGEQLTPDETRRLAELHRDTKDEDKLRETARAKLLRVAMATDPQPITLSMTGQQRASKETRQRLAVARDFVSTLTEKSDRHIARKGGKSFQVEVKIADVTRASAHASGGWIKVGRNTTTRIIVHELGHLFEGDGSVLTAATEFIRKRAGKSLVDLRDEVPGHGYRGDERTRKGWKSMLPAFGGDRNLAAYAAKHYVSGFTDVVSMGLEQLYNDPFGFARDDPEYFDLILNVVRGTLP